MPIVDVEIVGAPEARLRDGLARRIADAAGEVLRSRPGGTWVRLRYLDAAHYAENGGAPEGVRPVLVSVLQAVVPDGDALSEQAARLASAVAEACGRPVENVHVVFEPPAAGRIAFGGKLRR